MDAFPRMSLMTVILIFSLALAACGNDPYSNMQRTLASEDPVFDPMTGGQIATPKLLVEDIAKRLLEDPSQGSFEQAKGFYSNGSQINPSILGNAGPGFFKIFLGHDTAWTSYDMSYIIHQAAELLTHDFPNREPVEVGDCSSRRGGKLFQHASHQNGLDCDIRFLSKDGHTQNPNSGGDFDENFVRSGKVTANFDTARNWTLLRNIVDFGRTKMIFMDPAIKKNFCSYVKNTTGLSPAATETLRRFIPYANHKNHFHLRITCPVSSPRCISQGEPTAGSGC
jgi:penicillin-insensitive murein endopeptidase